MLNALKPLKILFFSAFNWYGSTFAGCFVSPTNSPSMKQSKQNKQTNISGSRSLNLCSKALIMAKKCRLRLIIRLFTVTYLSQIVPGFKSWNKFELHCCSKFKNKKIQVLLLWYINKTHLYPETSTAWGVQSHSDSGCSQPGQWEGGTQQPTERNAATWVFSIISTTVFYTNGVSINPELKHCFVCPVDYV